MDTVETARLAHRQGQPQQAIQILVAGLKANPQRPELWEALAEIVPEPAKQQDCLRRARALRALSAAPLPLASDPTPAPQATAASAQPATPSPVAAEPGTRPLQAAPSRPITPTHQTVTKPPRHTPTKSKGKTPIWVWVASGLAFALACVLFAVTGVIALLQVAPSNYPQVAQSTARPAPTADCRAEARHYYDRIAPTLGLILTLDDANALLLTSPTVDDLATVLESVPGRGTLIE